MRLASAMAAPGSLGGRDLIDGITLN